MGDRVLVVGATGMLGGAVMRLLVQQGTNVRVLLRNPARRDEFQAKGVDVAIGDLRDAATLAAACSDVAQVVTTANSFMGKGANSSPQVDLHGNRKLIDAARSAGVRRFVFVSADTAAPDSMVDFFRYKAEAEEHLRQSGMDYVIIRPTAFMDVWAEIVAGKITTNGAATIFGAGDNPVNFVARADVADFIARTVADPTISRESLLVAGPENLSLLNVAEKFERHYGLKAKRKHVPVPAMKVMRVVFKPFNPVLSRMMAGGVFMATQPQARDTQPITGRFAWYQPRTLDQWLAQRNS